MILQQMKISYPNFVTGRAVETAAHDFKKSEENIMLSAEFLEAAKTMVILTTFWAIIVLDIWAIGSMITHFIMWVYKGIKKLSKKKNRE